MDKQKRKLILVTCFLIVAISLTVAPAMAALFFPTYNDVKITPDRVTYLQNQNWGNWITQGPGDSTNYYLKYNQTGLNLEYQNEYDVGTLKCYECASPDNTYLGACTSFAEAAAYPDHSFHATDMKKGRAVSACRPLFGGFYNNIAEGTIIATYPPNSQADSSYISGHIPPYHAAVFCDWHVKHVPGNLLPIYDGIWVWDQKFYPGPGGHYPIIGKHLIMFKTGTLTDADNTDARNYYVVHL